VPSLWSVNKQKQKILGLFLYLNDESIKNLYTKCEKLIFNLQVGEDDDAMSEMDDTSMDKGRERRMACLTDFWENERRTSRQTGRQTSASSS
jgi:hypothetical protein